MRLATPNDAPVAYFKPAARGRYLVTWIAQYGYVETARFTQYGEAKRFAEYAACHAKRAQVCVMRGDVLVFGVSAVRPVRKDLIR